MRLWHGRGRKREGGEKVDAPQAQLPSRPSLKGFQGVEDLYGKVDISLRCNNCTASSTLLTGQRALPGLIYLNIYKEQPLLLSEHLPHPTWLPTGIRKGGWCIGLMSLSLVRLLYRQGMTQAGLWWQQGTECLVGDGFLKVWVNTKAAPWSTMWLAVFSETKKAFIFK